jgi:competence CoiA-like predicted nuclease
VDAALGRIVKPDLDYYDPHNQPERLREIIDKRYRKKGYRIVWLMFSSEEDKKQADLTKVSEFIQIKNEDWIFANGVSFIEHTTLRKYPSSARILSRVLKNTSSVEELVIGGFHLWDCVEKIALRAYKKGYPVRVDEDLTEHYFCRTCLNGPIPYNRRTSSALRNTLKRMSDDWEREYFLRIRQTKPWLEQL